MITFKHRRDRGYNAYKRGTKRFKKFEGCHLPMSKSRGWSRIKYYDGSIERFLLANVGRPIDKVFSEFTKRCESSIYGAKKWFFSYIEKKENIGVYGGFYVTNGILNHKKRRKLDYNKEYREKWNKRAEYNKRLFPNEKKLIEFCEKAHGDHLVYIGKFYIDSKEPESVFLRKSDSFVGFFDYHTMNITGIGTHVSFGSSVTSTGRIQKYAYTFSRSYFSNIKCYEFVAKVKKNP